MAEEFLEAFEPHLASVKLVPAAGGVFEVSVDGRTIHSKARSGRFPRLEDLREKIEPLLEP